MTIRREEILNLNVKKALDTGFCIFHDDKYLQDKNTFLERKQQVIKRLMDKVDNSIAHDKALYCIGYYLQDIKIEELYLKVRKKNSKGC